MARRALLIAWFAAVASADLCLEPEFGYENGYVYRYGCVDNPFRYGDGTYDYEITPPGPTNYPTAEPSPSTPCRDAPGGAALLVSGLRLQRANGVYTRSDSKRVRGSETYWLGSGLLFMYSCEERWLIIEGSAYGSVVDPDPHMRLTDCDYLVESSAYPTFPTARWTAWNDSAAERELTDQPDGRAECLPACDVADGSGPSSAYPCTCGSTWCVSAQQCTASSSSCSPCPHIRISGLDEAVQAAAQRPRLAGHVSPLADPANRLNLDGLYRRNDCKRVSGMQTYWRTVGDWYLYRCAYHRWAIADNRISPWDEQDQRADCWSTARTLASELDMLPLGTSRWEVHDGREYLHLEHDNWHDVLSCPATNYVPPCSAGPWPAGPTSHPGPPPVPRPAAGFGGCISPNRKYRVDGKLQETPCSRPGPVASYGPLRLWACQTELVLCHGDPRGEHVDCRSLGNLGCSEGIFDAAVRPDGRRAYLACRGGVRSCMFDSGATNPFSSCVMLNMGSCPVNAPHCDTAAPAMCPPGSHEKAVALAPQDPDSLVLGCYSQFSADEGVLLCQMHSDGTRLARQCERKGESPCGAAGMSSLVGLTFDSAGGLLGGCKHGGYAYCGFTPQHGPSSCSMDALGPSPCPLWIDGVSAAPAGWTAVSCAAHGIRYCRHASPTAAPMARPVSPPLSLTGCRPLRRVFTVDGGPLQSSPCPRETFDATHAGGGKYLFACISGGAVFCSGDGVDASEEHPVVCSHVGDLSCPTGQVKSVSFNSQYTAVYAACDADVRRCQWSPAGVGPCAPVAGAECPQPERGRHLHQGVHVLTDNTLLLSCYKGTLMMCLLLPGGGAVDGSCQEQSSPCMQVRGSVENAAPFVDNSGGLAMGCWRTGYAYCSSYSPATGPSGCGASLGPVPCEKFHGFMQLESATAAFCGIGGYLICPPATGFPSGFPTAPPPTGFPSKFPSYPTGFPSSGFPSSRWPSASPSGFPTTGFPIAGKTGFPSRYPDTGFPSSGFPSTGFPSTMYPTSGDGDGDGDGDGIDLEAAAALGREAGSQRLRGSAK
eukprot:TRINITY_DN940_c1_g1_i1.p1 TRINITY_DN940_c1_g1~~TRINITY_DN940_c1_g1_i1.p1  ORF type:complete len:1077 (+),score=239.97 TRINITY_DN940_c1_g1_i1:79-3231(+)